MTKRPPLALFSVVTLLAATSAIAASTGAYYESDIVDPAPLKYPDDTLLRTLVQETGRKKVTSVKSLTTGATETAKLTRTEQIAALYIVGSNPGAEMDLLVEEKGKYVPVETFWEDGVITVKTGTPRAEIYGKASSADELQKKYGVGPFIEDGAKWDNGSLFIVESALATLTKAELAGVAGLPFHRMPKDPRNKQVRGTSAAMYVPDSQQIEVYDYAIEADTRRFAGDVDHFFAGSVHTVIHECAHALSKGAARVLRRRAVDAKAEYDALNAKLIEGKKAYDADRATYAKTKDAALGKSLQEKGTALKAMSVEVAEKAKAFQAISAQMIEGEKKGSTIERAYDAKFPFQKAPTIYGRSTLVESFAESFALWKVDRAALERAVPGAPAWFEGPEFQKLIAGN